MRHPLLRVNPRRRLEQARLAGLLDRLRATADAELLIDRADVRLYRVRAQLEALRDVTPALMDGKPRQDLALLGREHDVARRDAVELRDGVELPHDRFREGVVRAEPAEPLPQHGGSHPVTNEERAAGAQYHGTLEGSRHPLLRQGGAARALGP